MGTFAFIVGVSDTAAQQQTASETLNLTISAVAAPVVTAVQDAESSLTTVVPGEWVAIYGRELAGTTRAWAAADFNNGNTLPTALDGVSVQFNGHSAAVYYVSPTQIDVQAPSAIQGNASVTVSFDGVTSAPIAAAVVQNAPSLFYYVAGTNLYAAATHADGTLIGDPLISGSTVSKSHPGETIVLYVNGLAASPGGTIITAPVAYTDPITVTVGGQTATVIYAGLVAAGEYQINVTLPDSLGTGDLPIMVQTVGQSSPAGVLLPAGPAGALRPEFEPRGHVSLSAGRGP